MSKKTKTKDFIGALKGIVGTDAVLDSEEDMVVFEFDASIDKARPQAVVFPNNTSEVSQVVKLCNGHGVPIVPRGAGTGLSGGALAVKGGIVLGTTRMTKVLEVDTVNHMAVVEPGLVNLHLSQKVAKHGLHYVPDPSSQKTCTIGGNVAENSGGPHCLAYGVTTNHVLGLEVVLPDGQVTWLGGSNWDHLGYDLPGTFIGSEGTLGIATKVAVRLVRNPEAISTMIAVFEHMEQATDAVSSIIANGIIPAALEMIDRFAIQAVNPAVNAGFPEDADAVLLVEVEGLTESVAEELEAAKAICQEFGAREIREAADAAARERLWAARKGAFGALGRLAPNYYVLDGVVPRTRLTDVLREVNAICERYEFNVANVFHAGDGNLHPCIAFDERIEGESIRVLKAGAEVMRACIEAGGSITGEHGVGVEKQEFMSLVFTPDDMAAMEKLRVGFGANDVLNPCKIFPSRAGCGEGWRLPKLPSLGDDVYI